MFHPYKNDQKPMRHVVLIIKIVFGFFVSGASFCLPSSNTPREAQFTRYTAA